MDAKKFYQDVRVSQPFGTGSFGRAKTLTIFDHDLPSQFIDFGWAAVDTETDGLDYRKDKLRLVTIFNNAGDLFLVRNPDHKSKQLNAYLSITEYLYFHHAMFDLGFLAWWTGFRAKPEQVRCTKIKSKILQPNMKSGLGSVARRILDIKLGKNKKVTLSDWNAELLSQRQVRYAAGDVLFIEPIWWNIPSSTKYAGISTTTVNNATRTAVANTYNNLEGLGYTQSFDGKYSKEERLAWLNRKKVLYP